MTLLSETDIKATLGFLNLDKPIVFFDLETTGTKQSLDRIIEISAIKLYTNGAEEFKTKRLNPEMPIPLESTSLHGIKDEDVKECPTFKQIAKSLLTFFADSHLGGFGISNFDIKILQNEFKRVNIDFTLENRAIIDAMAIYHKNEPRNLTSALKFYCDKEILNAHNARADVDASIEVLNGQFKKYQDLLPKDIYELSSYCSKKSSDSIDSEGKLIMFNNEVYISFGKYAGLSLKDVIKKDKDYLAWILSGNFSDEVKGIIKQCIDSVKNA